MLVDQRVFASRYRAGCGLQPEDLRVARAGSQCRPGVSRHNVSVGKAFTHDIQHGFGVIVGHAPNIELEQRVCRHAILGIAAM